MRRLGRRILIGSVFIGWRSALCFVFAVFVEMLQYFKLAEKLGFPKGSPAYIIIGNYFSWEDILCYAIGCLSVFFMM